MRIIDPSEEAAKKPVYIRLMIVCVRIISTIIVTYAVFFMVLLLAMLFIQGCSPQPTEGSTQVDDKRLPWNPKPVTEEKVILVQRIEPFDAVRVRLPKVKLPSYVKSSQDFRNPETNNRSSSEFSPWVEGHEQWVVQTPSGEFRAVRKIAALLQSGRRYRVNVTKKSVAADKTSQTSTLSPGYGFGKIRPPRLRPPYHSIPVLKSLDEQNRRANEHRRMNPKFLPENLSFTNNGIHIVRVIENVDQRIAHLLGEFVVQNRGAATTNDLKQYYKFREQLTKIADKSVGDIDQGTSTHPTIFMPNRYVVVATALNSSEFLLQGDAHINPVAPEVSTVIKRLKEETSDLEKIGKVTKRFADLPAISNRELEIARLLDQSARTGYQIIEHLVRLRDLPKPDGSLELLGPFFRNCPTVAVDEKRQKELLRVFAIEWQAFLDKEADVKMLALSLPKIAQQYAPTISASSAPFRIDFDQGIGDADGLDFLTLTNGSQTLVDATLIVEIKSAKGLVVKNIHFIDVIPANKKMTAQYSHGIQFGERLYEQSSFPDVKEIKVTLYSPAQSAIVNYRHSLKDLEKDAARK